MIKSGIPELKTVNLALWVKNLTSKSAVESSYSETSSYSLKAHKLSHQEFNEIHWVLAMKDAPWRQYIPKYSVRFRNVLRKKLSEYQRLRQQ